LDIRSPDIFPGQLSGVNLSVRDGTHPFTFDTMSISEHYVFDLVHTGMTKLYKSW